MRVGFIGLGTMGSGISANMRKAGHEMVVHDARRQAAEKICAAGAEWADSPKAVAEATEVVFTSLPGPQGIRSRRARRQRADRRHVARPAAVRPHDQFADRHPQPRAAVRRARCRAARQSGERRPGRRPLGQDGDLGRRRRAGLPALPPGARRGGRPGLVYRPDRRGLGRQAGAQSQRLHDPDGVGRGLHHGREGGRRSADLVEGGAQRRHRPAAHLRWPGRSFPARRLRSAALCAEARAQGRVARHPGRPRDGRADAAGQPDARGDDRGAGARLGRPRFALVDDPAEGAVGAHDQGRSRRHRRRPARQEQRLYLRRHTGRVQDPTSVIPIRNSGSCGCPLPTRPRRRRREEPTASPAPACPWAAGRRGRGRPGSSARA